MECLFCSCKSLGMFCMENHYWTHTKMRPFLCPECPKELKSKASLTLHLASHKPREEWEMKCHLCKKVFCSKDALKQHEKGTHLEKRHGCRICGRKFAKMYQLNNHLRVHAPKRERFLCRNCPKSFLDKYAYEEHQHIHQDEGYSFQCDKCEQRFHTSRQLKVHKRRVHLETSRILSCAFCEKQFAIFAALKNHMHNHTQEREYFCSAYPAEFCKRKTLLDHIKKVHSKVKEQFKCDMCSKLFLSKQGFNDHIQQHTGELPYICQSPGCGMRFPVNGLRYRHFSRVHIREQFTCNVCGKQFNMKNNLKRHALVHSDFKGFQCKVCDTSYKDVTNLKRHERAVHHN